MKIRTRTTSVFNIKDFTPEYVVEVNIGTGWAFLVEDGKIKRFLSKEEASAARKDIVKRYRSEKRKPQP